MESISRIEAFVNVLDAFLSILWMGSLAACFRLRPNPSSKRRFSVRCGINAEKPRLFQDDLTRQGREDEQQTERKREEDSERGGIRESKREKGKPSVTLQSSFLDENTNSNSIPGIPGPRT